MFANRLTNFVIFSLLLHIGLSVIFVPVFDHPQPKNFLYSWGQFYQAPSKTCPIDFLDRVVYREYLLPLAKQDSADLTKITTDPAFSKNLPQVHIKQPVHKKAEAYFLSLNKEKALVTARFHPFLDESEPLRKYLAKDKISFDILISPSGRPIWAQEFSFSGDVWLRFDLDDWIRSLVFEAQQTYYWKNLEIVLQ